MIIISCSYYETDIRLGDLHTDGLFPHKILKSRGHEPLIRLDSALRLILSILENLQIISNSSSRSSRQTA